MKSIICLLILPFLSLHLIAQENCENENPLEFLKGEWKYTEYFVTEEDTTLHGSGEVSTRAFFDCGINQQWTGLDENGELIFTAQTTITFDVESQTWIQHSLRKFIEGEIQIYSWKGNKTNDGWRWIFEQERSGNIVLVRVTWTDITNDRYISIIETSVNFGDNWNTIAYGEYIRVK